MGSHMVSYPFICFQNLDPYPNLIPSNKPLIHGALHRQVAVYPSINQPTNQASKQSINQSINYHFQSSLWCVGEIDPAGQHVAAWRCISLALLQGIIREVPWHLALRQGDDTRANPSTGESKCECFIRDDDSHWLMFSDIFNLSKI